VLPKSRKALNSTISSAGSARKPTIISRRAPMVPKAVPTSIAASDRKTRAVAKRPMSAMASAARAKGRSVASEGMIPAASTMVPKRMYGVVRKRTEASLASTASFWKSLRSMRYCWRSGGAVRFCIQARHCAIHPVKSGAMPMASSISPN